jgi:hypothetical protein
MKKPSKPRINEIWTDFSKKPPGPDLNGRYIEIQYWPADFHANKHITREHFEAFYEGQAVLYWDAKRRLLQFFPYENVK